LKSDSGRPPATGRLFVFEGPDGVGKTTLSREATRFLVDMGQKADYLSFPGRDPGTVGRVVYDLHHSVHARELSATAVQALHVAAHVDAIERHIRPRLANGINVFLDRYWWSTWVYGVCGGIDSTALRALIDFEERVWGSPCRGGCNFRLNTAGWPIASILANTSNASTTMATSPPRYSGWFLSLTSDLAVDDAVAWHTR
jgi:hypothetical protein